MEEASEGLEISRKNRKGRKKNLKKEMIKVEKKEVREIRLLAEGFRPQKNKIGSEFKGRNKVIIA